MTKHHGIELQKCERWRDMVEHPNWLRQGLYVRLLSAPEQGVGRVETVDDDGATIVFQHGSERIGWDSVRLNSLVEASPDGLEAALLDKFEQIQTALVTSPADVIRLALIDLGGESDVKAVQRRLRPLFDSDQALAAWWRAAATKRAIRNDPLLESIGNRLRRLSTPRDPMVEMLAEFRRMPTFQKDEAGTAVLNRAKLGAAWELLKRKTHTDITTALEEYLAEAQAGCATATDRFSALVLARQTDKVSDEEARKQASALSATEIETRVLLSQEIVSLLPCLMDRNTVTARLSEECLRRAELVSQRRLFQSCLERVAQSQSSEALADVLCTSLPAEPAQWGAVWRLAVLFFKRRWRQAGITALAQVTLKRVSYAVKHLPDEKSAKRRQRLERLRRITAGCFVELARVDKESGLLDLALGVADTRAAQQLLAEALTIAVTFARVAEACETREDAATYALYQYTYDFAHPTNPFDALLGEVIRFAHCQNATFTQALFTRALTHEGCDERAALVCLAVVEQFIPAVAQQAVIEHASRLHGAALTLSKQEASAVGRLLHAVEEAGARRATEVHAPIIAKLNAELETLKAEHARLRADFDRLSAINESLREELAARRQREEQTSAEAVAGYLFTVVDELDKTLPHTTDRQWLERTVRVVLDALAHMGIESDAPVGARATETAVNNGLYERLTGAKARKVARRAFFTHDTNGKVILLRAGWLE